MSHIHFPDGILPIWLWFSGFILMIIISLILLRLKKEIEIGRKLPILGMMSALMILGANIEIIPIAYHINLTVVSGILLGPSLVFFATFIVNIILALLGHGGVTVIGLNTLILSLEGILGFIFFRLFIKVLKKLAPSIFFATILALCISTFSMIGVVWLGKAHYGELIHREEDVKIFGLKIITLEKIKDETDAEVDLKRFIRIIIPLGFIGWILEGIITTLIVKYIYRLRPNLLFEN